MQSAIQKNVMRRVYYSYGLSVVTHSMFWQGVLFGGSVALFGRLTHVASLIHNFLSVPVSSVPQYVGNAFTHAFSHGEMLTVVVTLGMVALAASFALRVLPTLVVLRPMRIA